MSYDWDEGDHIRRQTALTANFWTGIIIGALIEALLILIAAALLWAFL